VQHRDGVRQARVDEGGTASGPRDWSGHVAALPPAVDALPAPRVAAEGPAGERGTVLESPLTRMVLARARGRAAVALDVVTFTAACPACGTPRTWTQERLDTRVRSAVDCDCGPRPDPPGDR